MTTITLTDIPSRMYLYWPVTCKDRLSGAISARLCPKTLVGAWQEKSYMVAPNSCGVLQTWGLVPQDITPCVICVLFGATPGLMYGRFLTFYHPVAEGATRWFLDGLHDPAPATGWNMW